MLSQISSLLEAHKISSESWTKRTALAEQRIRATRQIDWPQLASLGIVVDQKALILLPPHGQVASQTES